MSNMRNWLEGEVRYAEGKTTIKNLIPTLAKELTTSTWRTLERTALDEVWTFDHKKEIWLPAAYDNTNMRIYKAEEQAGAFTKGTLIPSTDYNIVHNIIIGGEGIDINQHVFVEVLTLATEFQRGCFLAEQIDSGDTKNILHLKSRPAGKVQLFEDEIVRTTGETAVSQGDNKIYTVARGMVSNTRSLTDKLVVKKNNVEVDENDYVVDYWNGVIIFNEVNLPSDTITADYSYSTRKGGTVIIDPSRYMIVGDKIYDVSEDEGLINENVIVMVDYTWELVAPLTVDEIEDSALFKISIDTSETFDKTQMQDYYWELRYTDYENQTSTDYRTHIETRYGDKLDSSETSLDDETSSEWTPFSWYKPEAFSPIENNGGTIHFEDWLPVHYWLNHTGESLNIVIQGDPGVDIAPYQNYIIGYGYLGAIDSFPCMATEDRKNNFAFTFGSHAIPAEGEFVDIWGSREATGNSDISMIRTQSNIPFQAHYPSFHTVPEFMDKHFITVSQWTGTHHFSEVTVVHAYERERGKLRNMLIGDRSSIFHLDELISNKDTFDYRGALHNCSRDVLDKGYPLESKQKHWKMFNINAPYWFGNNSPNLHYGVAIRMR